MSGRKYVQCECRGPWSLQERSGCGGIASSMQYTDANQVGERINMLSHPLLAASLLIRACSAHFRFSRQQGFSSHL